MPTPNRLPGFSASLSFAESSESRRGILRYAQPTQSLVQPQDACCGNGTCAGVCACVPFLGCQCAGVCV
jgi:hypothetical protein